MKNVAGTAREWLRAELWPIPTVGLVVAVLLGFQLPRLDRSIDDGLPGWLSSIVFDGGPGAAQTVLDAVSSSLITVTALTFSLTVVTLQLASSQFSPRLLRTFASDLFVQVTLALFLGTFVYSLAVLRLVRSEDGKDAAFVPRLSVTLAFALVVASVFMLVLFLAHLTRTIRVESMLVNVHAEASSTIRRTLDEHHPDTTVPSPPHVPHDASRVESCTSGLVTRIGEKALLQAALDADAIISIDVRPGDQIIQGLPVARAWARVQPETVEAGSDAVERADDDLAKAIDAAIHRGPERTASQDIGFGLRQLTDVANKALSPGINDPTTAVHAIGHLAALLCDLADHHLGPKLVCDAEGRVRVVLARPSFDELLDAAISGPRRFGATDPDVLAHLLRLLEAVGHRVPPRLIPDVRDQLHRLQRTIRAQDFDDTELTNLRSLEQQIMRRIGH